MVSSSRLTMTACASLWSNVHSNPLKLNLCIKLLTHQTHLYFLMMIYNNIYRCKAYLKFIGVFVFLIQSRMKHPSETIAYLRIYLSVHPFIYLPKLEVGDTVAAAAAAASLQSCPTLCDPIDGSQPGFPSLGFSRQEHWSGLPFPSPMHESEKWKWSRSVVSDSSDPMNCSLPGFSVHGIF